MKTFEITEQPVEMGAGGPEAEENALAVVERDVRALMRRLGEKDFAIAEQKKEQEGNTRKTLLSLLTVMDSFERVFTAIHKKQDLVDKQMKKWIANFRTIHRMLKQMLSDQGVSRIENLDKGFDPHWHKVFETVTDASEPDGTIVEEVKGGYVWHGAILRKSEVIVVRNEAEPRDTQAETMAT